MSPGAAKLYQRLTADTYHVLDSSAELLDDDARELVAKGFARIRPGEHPQLVPVAPAVAAQIVLRDLSAKIAMWHQESTRTVRELIKLERDGMTVNGGAEQLLAQVITDADHIVALVHDVQVGLQQELLSFEIPITAGSACQPRLSPAAGAPPPRWRTVFTTGYLVPEWQWILDTTVHRGGQVRVTSSAPMKLLVADRSQALVPLDNPGVAGMVLFRSATVIGALATLFDAVWERASPYPADSNSAGTLTPFEQHIVGLLSAGLKDDDIATSAHVSVRTVRRNIASIMGKLGVKTRFAAGIQANKRGWL